eukprot:m.173468 g.173468  ORF g.173468 m.173468 type:complete len:167 (-) comp14849_c0_seq2:2093-2593(-)
MVDLIETEWHERLRALGVGAHGGPAGWAFVPMFEWLEAKFSSLLTLVPELIETYEGCDETGASMRRHTIVEEAVVAAAGVAGVGDGGAESEEDDGLDEEERARRAAIVEAKRAKKAEEQARKEREAQAEAMRKRHVSIHFILWSRYSLAPFLILQCRLLRMALYLK